MQNGELLDLPIEIESEDEEVYLISPYQATIDNIEYIWDRVGKFEFMFSDEAYKDKDVFFRYLLSPGVVVLMITEGESEEEIKPVGIVYIDRIRPGYDARMHYIFWDRKQRGRHRVLFTAAEWFFTQFGFHRMSMEVPVFAFAALRRLRKLGARIEGRKRGAAKHNGKWHDILLFGVHHDEITRETIEEGKLERTEDESTWFGLLDNDSVFSHSILKEH